MRDIFRLKLSKDKEFVISDSEAIFGVGVMFVLVGLALNSPEAAGVGVGLAALGIVVNAVPSPSEELQRHKQKRFKQLISNIKKNKDNENKKK